MIIKVAHYNYAQRFGTKNLQKWEIVDFFTKQKTMRIYNNGPFTWNSQKLKQSMMISLTIMEKFAFHYQINTNIMILNLNMILK